MGCEILVRTPAPGCANRFPSAPRLGTGWCAAQAAAPTLKIQRAIVNKDALLRLPLGKIKSKLVDFRMGFGDAKIAGTEKDGEVLPKAKSFDPVKVQFARFVVQRREKNFAGLGESRDERERIGKRLRLGEDELAHLLFAKWARRGKRWCGRDIGPDPSGRRPCGERACGDGLQNPLRRGRMFPPACRAPRGPGRWLATLPPRRRIRR